MRDILLPGVFYCRGQNAAEPPINRLTDLNCDWSALSVITHQEGVFFLPRNAVKFAQTIRSRALQGSRGSEVNRSALWSVRP
ncbi:unnamed protein product [Arctogadus glacialis]